jgi:hypothetical protein
MDKIINVGILREPPMVPTPITVGRITMGTATIATGDSAGCNMERSYIQWNLPNWITIFLMAALSTAAIGAISSGIKASVGAKM